MVGEIIALSICEASELFSQGKRPPAPFWYMVVEGGGVLGKTCQSNLGKGQDQIKDPPGSSGGLGWEI